MGAEPIQEPYLVEEQSGRFGGARLEHYLFFLLLTVKTIKIHYKLQQ